MRGRTDAASGLGTTPTAFTWTCPTCGRRVPARVLECRCGSSRRAADGSLASLAGGETPDEARGRVSVRRGALGLLGLAGLGLCLWAHPDLLTPSAWRAQSSGVGAQTSDGAQRTAAAPPPSPIPGTDRMPAPAVRRGDPSAHRPAPPAQPPQGAAALVPAPGTVTSATPAPSPGPPLPALEDIVAGAIPAVVSIETPTSRGTGFFVAQHTILTNQHVVGLDRNVQVRLASGLVLPGHVVATTTQHDLALVRAIHPDAHHPVLPLGSPEQARVGQEVIAIGLAMGQLDGTVTRGIISAFRRASPDSETTLIQTDAAINPGNSGGPLLDRRGRVVGITTLKMINGAESIGFAVAASHARDFLEAGPVMARVAPPRIPPPPVAGGAAPLRPADPRGLAGPGAPTRSTTDARRAQGLSDFTHALAQVEAQADRLDQSWHQVETRCGARVRGRYDRTWFGLWDGTASMPSAAPSCLSSYQGLTRAAGEVRQVMTTLHEAARQAAVYPGDLRRARTEARLDWAGW